MLRPITVTAEFTAELTVNDSIVTEVECRAVATVTPSFEVMRFREIEVFDLLTAVYIPAEWLTPHIQDYLITGKADSRFLSAAETEGFGPDPDAIRDLRAAQ